MIEIRLVHGKGRAVIASCFIERGELIESAPAVAFSPEEREIMKETVSKIFEYCFVGFDEYSKSHKCSGYIAFGLSSFCNHSEQPNARIEWEERETGTWANLISLRDIEAGEEMTLYYTNVDEYPHTSEFL